MSDIVEQSFCDVLHRIHNAAQDGNRYGLGEGYISSVTEDGVPIRKLFVGNISQRTTYKHLIHLFSKYGTVESCFLCRNHGKRNHAFITFTDVAGANRARCEAEKMPIRLHYKDLRVMPADSWHQPDNIENDYYNTKKDLHKSEKALVNEQCNQNYIEHDLTGPSIDMLNDDCLMHIFLYLGIVDRIRIERVSKRWQAVSQKSWCMVKKLNLKFGISSTISDLDLAHLTTISLRKVLLRCGRFLTAFDLSDTGHSLSQNTMTVVSKLCPNLQEIDISGITVSAYAINSLVTSCHNIKSFSLGCTTSTCDSELSKLFAVNTKLERLKLVRSNIGGKCLLHLSPDAMEDICLERCKGSFGNYLSDAIHKFKNLKSLVIADCNVEHYSSALRALDSYESLRTLYLGEDLQLPHDEMLKITQLINLEELVLCKIMSVDDKFLTILVAKCQQLVHLDLSGCPLVTDVGLSAITMLPKLETLYLRSLGKIKGTGFVNLHNLKKLDCKGCFYLQDDCVISVIECASRLELLDLSHCSKITAKTINTAVRVTRNRTNNIVLRLYAGYTSVQPCHIEDCSPFLLTLNLNPHSIEFCRNFAECKFYHDLEDDYDDEDDDEYDNEDDYEYDNEDDDFYNHVYYRTIYGNHDDFDYDYYVD